MSSPLVQLFRGDIPPTRRKSEQAIWNGSKREGQQESTHHGKVLPNKHEDENQHEICVSRPAHLAPKGEREERQYCVLARLSRDEMDAENMHGNVGNMNHISRRVIAKVALLM